MDQILEILEEIQPGTDFLSPGHFIEEGVLDSMDIVTLVSELNDEFDVEIGVSDVIPENFQSVQKIWALIQRLQEEG